MFNATAPVVSNYGLGTKSDAWSTTVRKGLQYIKVDIMKKREKHDSRSILRKNRN